MTRRTLTLHSLASTTAIVAIAAAPHAALAETRQAAAIRAHRGTGAMPAVQGGLEIAIAGKHAQTVGDIGGHTSASDLVGSAGELDLQIGYRATPHLAISFYASAQSFVEGGDHMRDVHTGSAGLEVDFHFRPDRAIDPWISFGGGVRALLVDAAPGTSLLVGAELARVQLGADFRLDENIAIGPVIGAAASLYGAQRDPMQDDFAEIENKGINWTLSVGIAARFNAFGRRL